MNTQNVVVTGSSNGIGYLTVLTLARLGHRVYATMRQADGKNKEKKDELLSIATKENLEISVVELDVTDDDSIQEAVSLILNELRGGAIDVVINNAGVMYVGITEAYSIEQVKTQFDTNFFGVIQVTKAFLPYMRSNGQGLIINVSSLAGRLSFPYFGIYCASKWALEAYSESLKFELAPFGVDVAIVEPGPFPSGLLYSGPKEQDDSVLSAYGNTVEVPAGILNNFDQMFKSPDAPVTQEVADMISKLVKMEKGNRPFRSVAGLDFGTIDLNDATAPIQRNLIKDVLQMEHLLTIKA